MNLIVKTATEALWGHRPIRCAVGRGGIVPVGVKREGDGATPAGSWPMREIIYRADRVTLPPTALPTRAMTPEDGWCESPTDTNYNRNVRLPYPIAIDQMWREDHLYDIVVVLGYNDAPVVPDKGSAIFLHLARPDFSPSAGCVTVGMDDLLFVLKEANQRSRVVVHLP